MLNLQRAAWIDAHLGFHVEGEAFEGGGCAGRESDVHELGPHVVPGGAGVQTDVGGKLQSF